MTKLVSPVEPHELAKPLRRGLESVVHRVAARSAIEGTGADLLLRIYMAGIYHGMKLGAISRDQP